MGLVKNMVAYFVKYPILANIVIAFTLLAGLFTMVTTKKSFFPTRPEKFIFARVYYPGASPQEMEEGVTLKVEEAIKAIAGIEKITSTSSENSASVRIQIYDNYDIDEIFTEVKNAVDGISSFPAGAEKPVVYKQKQTSAAQYLSITGDVDLRTLKNFAEDVKDDLMKSDNIPQVRISGFPDTEVSVEIREQDLLRYGITFDQIANSIRTNNRDISAGLIKSEKEELVIRSKNKSTKASKISDIIIRSNSDGSKLYLKDLADVKEQFAETSNINKHNGRQAVFLAVLKQETDDLEKISKEVNKYVKEFNKKHQAVQLNLNWDFMGMLKQRLNLLTSNGVTGLILVLIALGLFLSLRLSFWVAWGIPSSFLGMFILGSFVGLTINMISLFGMILVIGILVDDGIVIAENIYSHFEKTKNPVKAAIDGTMEVLPAVFTSVTTTIVAFLPLIIITGDFQFLKDMAIVVCFSLGFSLLEAFFVLPAHLASSHVLKMPEENTRGYKIRAKLNSVIDFFKIKVYGKMLRFTINNKTISIAILAAFLIINIGLMAGGLIKTTFFPQIPFTNFEVNIAFKPGVREDVTGKYLDKFEAAIWRVNEQLKKEKGAKKDIIQNIYTEVGSSDWENGSHTGNVDVFYDELDKYDMNQFDLIKLVKKEIGEVPEAEKFKVGGEGRFGKAVSVRLLSKDAKLLSEAKEYLKKQLTTLSELKEIEDDVPMGRRELLFDMKPEAYFLGLNSGIISKQMRQGFFGEEVQRFMVKNDEVKVWVRYPKSDRSSVSQLEQIRIKTTQGQEYPLAQLADYRVERGVTGIKHYNTEKYVRVQATMRDPFGEVPPVVKKVKEDIMPVFKEKFPEIEVQYGGQTEGANKSAQQFMVLLVSALVIIFFILMATFRSFYQAVLIIMMIPLGWFGGIFGHGVEDWISPDKQMPVSLLSLWGMIALSGVIINDAVVFLSKFNSLLKDDGLSVKEAAYEAGLARFRAIMLTSITTVVGLYPLIKETSFQAQFLIPMAISVAYGVLIGTFIILLYFPVFILVFNKIRIYAKWYWFRFKKFIHWSWTGDKEVGDLVVEKPTAEDVERVLIDQRRLAEKINH